MPRFAVTTFGCQMNVHDSERMREVLLGSGYQEEVEVESADVVVLNTCSVREKAEQKLRSEVGRLARLKREKRDVVLVVAGCVAQQEGERLLRSLPAIDLVLGPDNIAELPRLLSELSQGGLPLVRTVFDVDAPQFLPAAPVLPAAPGARGPTAYVTIMKGCDERCSFCIVPYTRGPERYRSSREILAEIEQLVAGGVREVTLLGQTVNSYRDPAAALTVAPDARVDDPDESEFAALLWAIAAHVPGLARLRYTSPHPRHVTPSLVRAHRELDVLARHVHLPVQSGSTPLLKRMIRRYTREDAVERSLALAAARPDMTLSTDIIVGFPGETEDDFLQTLSLVREVGYRGLFGFKYSPRPKTPALRLPDDVPEAVKSERLARLFALSEQLLADHLATLVGTTQEVLLEGPSKAGGASLSGRSARHEIVHVRDAAGLDLIGQVVPVRISRAFKHSLEGELPESLRRPPSPDEVSRPAGPRRLPVVATA